MGSARVAGGSQLANILRAHRLACVKSVVTGGAGFIGSHLADTLVARGDEVLVLDDYSSGKRENLTNYRIKRSGPMIIEITGTLVIESPQAAGG